MQAIAAHTGDADIHVLRTPRAVRRFFARVASGVPDQPLTARTDMGRAGPPAGKSAPLAAEVGVHRQRRCITFMSVYFHMQLRCINMQVDEASTVKSGRRGDYP